MNIFNTSKKRGTCVYYDTEKYVVDISIPIFTQDRNYIQKFVDVEEIGDK